MSGSQTARQLVENIAKDHGFIDESVWRRLGEFDADVRRTFEEAMLRKDQLIGSSAVTLARNLYSSNARFVCELLQNAEDNKYTRARSKGPYPFVEFRMYKEKIIVDCNEDGFTQANLTAICNIGMSSKTGAQGYIGEKGIGFKSVFMVAYKVLIQSGDFSFSFTHRRGDSGMGMISPMWEETENLKSVPPNGVTRITLFLHEESDPDVASRSREAIKKQFRELQETILIFMKNLSRIAILIFDDDDEEMYTATTYTVDRLPGNRVTTKKSTLENGSDVKVEVRHFHITKRIITDLEKNENRTYSDEELKARAYSASEVTLAFPLTSNSVPVLEKNWMFAFLPVRKMGFNFIVQADFVTNASREDIVTTSSRNKGLAQGVAETFVQAVLEMCEHDTLQFQWMRYLPSGKDGYPWDSFWSTNVIDRITERLKTTPVLRALSGGPLRRINSLRRLYSEDLDGLGRPMFRDIEPEVYVSDQYSWDDHYILMTLGHTRCYFISDIIPRIKHDLAQPDSRLKTSSDKDWQARAAKSLSRPWTLSGAWSESKIRQAVKELKILPLRNGQWTSITSGKVYYPETNGLVIPDDVDLSVVSPDALKIPERRALFDRIGVEIAPVELVRKKILELYTRAGSHFNPDFPSLVAHLHFLYLTHHLVQKNDHDYTAILIKAESGEFKSPRTTDFYLANNNTYGASKLLAPTPNGNGPDDGAPGHDVLFVHHRYLENIPERPQEKGQGFVGWLHEYFHVRRHLRLVEGGILRTMKVSAIFRYVAEHRPQKFLGLLRSLWGSDRFIFMEHDNCHEELLGTKVLCRDGVKRELRHTFFPRRDLLNTWEKFAENEPFPWLELATPLSHEVDQPEWNMIVGDLELAPEPGHLKFLFDMLYWLEEGTDDQEVPPSLPGRMCRLYKYIQGQVLQQEGDKAFASTIRGWFYASDEGDYPLSVMVPLPSQSRDSWPWVVAEDCIWGSPVDLTSLSSLDRLYRVVPTFEHDRVSLQGFFVDTLGIPQCTFRHIVGELVSLNSEDTHPDPDALRSLYGVLRDMARSEQDKAELKQSFNTQPLVCVFANDQDRPSWHTATECLWSSAAHIPGKVTLEEDYEDLKAFFVDFLGIKKMTIDMLYAKLVHPRSDGSVAEAKEDLRVLSTFLFSEPEQERRRLDPNRILQNTVFPVRSRALGERLVKGTTDFFIADQNDLATSFEDQANFLMFTLQEIVDIRPFIEWAGLEARCLKRAVKQITSADRNSTRPLRIKDREIKLRAHALLRIAMTWNSPRTRVNPQAFYDLLRNAQTLETDKIHTELQLHQDGQLLSVEAEAGVTLHIDESPDGLKIFLPKNKLDQEACFHTNWMLPKRLMLLLMTDPLTQITETCPLDGIEIMMMVSSCSPQGLTRTLEQNGIIDVDIANQDEIEEDSEEESDAEDADKEGQEHKAVHASDDNAEVPNSTGEDPDEEELEDEAEDVVCVSDDEEDISNNDDGTAVDGSIPIPTPPSTSPSNSGASNVVSASSRLVSSTPAARPVVVRDNGYHAHIPQPQVPSRYGELLRKVVESARTAAFPSSGPFNLDRLQDALNGEDGMERYFMHAPNRLERDRMVGAAGELYVFELLSRLDPALPAFSRENWRSTIRHYATEHPDYANMPRWLGRETADIVYHDHSGALTSLLIDQGYMSSWNTERLRQARPEYFIEVKATVGSFGSPFYMSKHQYQRMQNISNTSSRREQFDRIYVIFRVYNLGRDSMKLRVLVDPEGLRLGGELVFTGESWSVVPSSPRPATPVLSQRDSQVESNTGRHAPATPLFPSSPSSQPRRSLFSQGASGSSPTTGSLFSSGSSGTNPAAGGLFSQSPASGSSSNAGGLFPPGSFRSSSNAGGIFGQGTSGQSPVAGGLFSQRPQGSSPGARGQQQEPPNGPSLTVGGLFPSRPASATSSSVGSLFGQSTFGSSLGSGGLFSQPPLSNVGSERQERSSAPSPSTGSIFHTLRFSENRTFNGGSSSASPVPTPSTSSRQGTPRAEPQPGSLFGSMTPAAGSSSTSTSPRATPVSLSSTSSQGQFLFRTPRPDPVNSSGGLFGSLGKSTEEPSA